MKPNPSGKFVLRLRPAVHKALRAQAARRGISLNRLCQGVLETHLASRGRPLAREKGDAGLIARIQGLFGESLLGVVLFGSVAREAARAESDVDLLVVLEDKQEVTRRLYSLWDERFARDDASDVGGASGALSPHFVRLPGRVEEAGTVWLEAAIDGVVLHDRDGRISRFLAGVRRGVADGRFTRRSAYGMPYWVREGRAEHVQ